MWKPTRSRAEQQFAAGQKQDQTLIKQKEKTQRERDERMARLRDLRLAKEAAEKAAAGQPEGALNESALETSAVSEPPAPAETIAETETTSPRLPRVHTHRS
jgi:hypothetical protein